MYLNNLFVYGTLLPGLDNHTKFINAYKPKVYEAKAKGVMYYLPQDGYPVVLPGEGVIKGVVFDTPRLPVIIPELDEIEKFTGVESQCHLMREIVDVVIEETGVTTKAHMFLWPPSKGEWLKENGQVIPDGDWLRFLNDLKR